MNIFCYNHHINDWRSKTAHLTHEQRGIYRHLIDEYYITGGALPSDLPSLYRICAAMTDSEKSAIAYVVGKYFDTENGMLRHKRCDEEIKKIEERSAKARGSANARHHPEPVAEEMPTQCERTADAMLPITHNPIPITQEQIKNTPLTPQTLPPLVSKTHGGFKKIGDGGGGVGAWQGEGALLPQDLVELLPVLAAGFDPEKVCNDYAKHIRKNGMPRDLRAAFPAWVTKYVKNHTERRIN